MFAELLLSHPRKLLKYVSNFIIEFLKTYSHYQLHKVADIFSAYLAELRKMPFEAQGDAVKETSRRLDDTVMPLVRKSKIREEFEKIKKAFVDEEKRRQTEVAKEVCSHVYVKFREDFVLINRWHY